MLGRHDTLDEMLERIDAVTLDDVRTMIDRMFAAPFALAAVGPDDSAVSAVRRDGLVRSAH